MTEAGSSASAQPQRRAFPRVPLRAKVQMEFVDQRCFLSEWAVNLSPGGMFVRSEAVVSPGQRFQFEAGLSPKGPRFSGIGEVLWARREWDGSARPPGFAVRFLEVEEEGRLAMQRLAEVFLGSGVAAMQEELVGLAGEWQRQRLDEESTDELEAAGEEELLPDTAVIPPPWGVASPAEGGAPAAAEASRAAPPEPPELAAETPASAAAAGEPTTVPVTASRASSGGRRRLGSLVAVLAVAASGYLLWRTLGSGPPPSAAARQQRARGAVAALPARAPEGLSATGGAALRQVTFESVAGVSWSEAPEGLWVVLAIEGVLPEGAYRHYRAAEPPPREVLQLFGARRRFAQRELPVGLPLLQQIRFGFHPGERTDELRVVLDLGSPSAVVRRVESAGDALRVLIGTESDRGAAPVESTQ